MNIQLLKFLKCFNFLLLRLLERRTKLFVDDRYHHFKLLSYFINQYIRVNNTGNGSVFYCPTSSYSSISWPLHFVHLNSPTSIVVKLTINICPLVFIWVALKVKTTFDTEKKKKKSQTKQRVNAIFRKTYNRYNLSFGIQNRIWQMWNYLANNCFHYILIYLPGPRRLLAEKVVFPSGTPQSLSNSAVTHIKVCPLCTVFCPFPSLFFRLPFLLLLALLLNVSVRRASLAVNSTCSTSSSGKAYHHFLPK